MEISLTITYSEKFAQLEHQTKQQKQEDKKTKRTL